MATSPTKKPPQPEKQTMQTATAQQWIVPTLAGLLERLSIASASTKRSQ